MADAAPPNQKRPRGLPAACPTLSPVNPAPASLRPILRPTLRLYRHAPPAAARPCALTIGNFDGVHRGHQAILQCLTDEAAARGLTPTVMTFAPHPRDYFALQANRPELVPTRICSLRDKVAALAQHGVAQALVLRFDARLAGMSADDFVAQLLVQGLQTRWLLVGADFRYGHKRQGDVARLSEAGRRYGFEVATLDDVTDADCHRVSSSEVRNALALGDLARAAHLLGHPYAISGRVAHGKKLGRTLGFPTMNLRVAPRCALRSGIYVVRLHGLENTPMPAVASLGARPSVEDAGRILLEVHALDVCVDAYGKLVRAEFLHRLRDEEKFPDLPTLTAAIARDADAARAWFARLC